MIDGAMTRRSQVPSLRLRFASTTAILGLVAVGATIVTAQEPALDESCVVSVLNRTAPVDTDGVWVLPNVPADIGRVRVRATCVEDGVTRGGESDFFTVPADGVIRVAEIRFVDPAPVPERLVLSAARTTLTEPGEVLPLDVRALFPDGTSADVAPAAAGTNYVASNPAVATVSPDGLVTAIASGTVILTALNEGATGFLRLQVVLSGDSDGDGIPDDVEVALGLDPNDPVDGLLDPDGDGLTNADEASFGTDPNQADTDGDGLTDGEEVTLTRTDPALFDTDGDGLSDGLEIATGSDPLDPSSFDLGAALAALVIRPATFILNTNTILPGEASVPLVVEGTLLDGTTLDLTDSNRGTAFSSSDLLVCNFGLEDGIVFGGAEGSCIITASNSGFETTAEGLVQEFTPGPVGSLPLPSYGNSVAVRDGSAFVAGGPGGLHVIDVSSVRQPRLVTSLPLAGNANDIVLDGLLAYVAAGEAGVHVLDLTDPSMPAVLGSVDTPGEVIALRAEADLVYLADGPAGLQVLSVADPAAPVVIGSWDTPGEANGLAVQGGLAVVSTFNAPLELIDVSTPSAPVGLSTLDLGVQTFDVELVGSIAYVATSDGLRAVDVSDPLMPRDLGAFGGGIFMIDLLAVGGDRLFTTQVDPRSRMPIFDLRQDPAAPLLAGAIEFSDLTADNGDSIHLAADERFVYMTASIGFLVSSKPGTSGPTRLLIGQHAPFTDDAGISPSVELVAPAGGDEVGGGSSLEVVVEAGDDIGVLDVELMVNGVPFRRDSVVPYRFLIDVPEGPGFLDLAARARDFGGNVAETPTVTVRIVEEARTDVTGRVGTLSGEAVAGATIFSSLGGTAISGADGGFLLEGLAATQDQVVVFASAHLDGVELRGRSAPVPVVAGGVTDVGVITLSRLGLPYPGPRSALPGGGTVLAMAVADFDHDGVLDVAATGGFSTTAATVFPGRGDGSFGQGFELPSSADAWEVAAADVNLDGLPDVVTTARASDVIRVYLGRGDGTFGDPTVLAAGDRPSGVAVGDLDLDLVPDLAVAAGASGAGQVLVFLGNGDGTFAPSGIVPVATVPQQVRLADFDGDGRLDFVTRRHLIVAFGNGDGTFEKPVALSPSATGDFSFQVWDHQVADFEGDGLPDIMVTEGKQFTTDGGVVYLSRGDRTFERRWGFSTFGEGVRLAAGDLNADGNVDALVTHELSFEPDTVMAALGDGTGGFQPLTRFGAGDTDLSLPLALADLEADGVPDLMVAGREGVSVFSGLGTGEFRTYRRERLFSLGDNPPLPLVSADLDLDGLDDLVAGFFSYYLQNPDGSFGAGIDLSPGFVPRDAVAVDLTRDGAPEIAVIGGFTVSIYPNAGDGTLSAPAEIPTSSSPGAVIAADVTGDGFLDLVVAGATTDAVSVFENDGTGGFGSSRSFGTGGSAGDLAALDFDEDGDLDLAVVSGTRTISLLSNAGDGIFTLADTLLLADNARGSAPSPVTIVAADLNGDGLPDLATANLLAESASAFLGRGGGIFSEERRFGAGDLPRDLLVTDVDMDGVSDLATVNSGSNDVSVLRGIGDGTFVREQRFATAQRPQRAVLLDVDHDGLRDDLVVGTKEQEVTFLVHR